jgi:uncharacterized membrane-anchored protein
MKRNIILFSGLALVLLAVSGLVLQKERLVTRGQRLYLELAPRDPRSLMQGDYMRLEYRIAREGRQLADSHRDEAAPDDDSGVAEQGEAWPDRGTLVIRPDERGVARLVRRHAGEPVGPGEVLLRYRRQGWRLHLGTDAWYFQEGTAGVYETARYGEVAVGSRGEVLLVGLRNEKLEVLGETLH